MFDDAGQRAALLQILGRVGGEKVVDPVVAVLDDAVAEEFGDLLEALLRLLARLGQRAIVRRPLCNVPLDLGPQQLDGLHLGTERRCVDQRWWWM